MMDRQSQLQWMRDLLEHVLNCHGVLEQSDTATANTFLMGKILGDLGIYEQLCRTLLQEESCAIAN